MTEELATASTDSKTPASAPHGSQRPDLTVVMGLVEAAARVEKLCEDLDRLEAEREGALSREHRQSTQKTQAAQGALLACREEGKVAVAAAVTNSARAHRDMATKLQAAGCSGAAEYAAYADGVALQGTFEPRPDFKRRQRELATLVDQIRTTDGQASHFKLFPRGVKILMAAGILLLLFTPTSSALDLLAYPALAMIIAPPVVRAFQRRSLRASAQAMRQRLCDECANWSKSTIAAIDAAKEEAASREASASLAASSEAARADSVETAACAEAKRASGEQIAVRRSEVEVRSRELRDNISQFDDGLVRGSWSDAAWAAWTPRDTAPSCVRFGRLLPRMPRFYHHFPHASTVEIPALTSYRGNAGLLFESDLALREAREIAQSIILRLLATLPPAAVRFVFIDPVSLGDNVAPFMSLERYEAALIGGKAWSEAGHIDRALAEVTDHMETVIQKYLRADFKTIGEYNAQARVKEAYRVVVVFDFPTGFGDSAAKRLVTIMRNGPRCGVFPVVIADTSKPLPYGFSLAELEQFALVMRQSDQRSARVGVEPRYHAYLTAVAGVDVIALTQQLQAITGVGAEQARRLGDSYALPTLIAQGVTQEKAGEIQSRLESVGARVRFEPANAASPTTAGLQTEDQHA